MRLRHRQMRQTDVAACVAIVGQWELARKRYGRYLERLPEVWSCCLRQGSIITSVVEDLDRISAGPLAVGVSAFVTCEFAEECRIPPLFWYGPKLVERILSRRSPLLGPAAIREANSGSGLDVLVWAGSVCKSSHVPALDLAVELMRSFYAEHAGYQLNRICSQAADERVLRYTMNTGLSVLLNQHGCQVEACQVSAEFVRRPFLLSFTRETAAKDVGSRTSELFLCVKPRIFFSSAEQRLLLAAIRGGTDRELSQELGLSLSMIKKLWRSTYERVMRELPDLLPDSVPVSPLNERGTEKKHKVLAYLRDNPQELRPVRRPTARHVPLATDLVHRMGQAQ